MAKKGVKTVKNRVIVQNPFCKDLIIPTRWKLTDYSSSDGSGNGSVEIDIARHIKVFPEMMDFLLGSTSGERFILKYIMNHITSRTFDCMDLKYEKVGMSKSSFYSSINGLIEGNVLMKKETRKNMYWINPDMIFRGNRVKTYKGRTEAVNSDPCANIKAFSKLLAEKNRLSEQDDEE